MLQFGVTNLRRLKTVEPIELKPITLLVGRNSSGKSSFLRVFPLLRQSLMTRTSSPILWYGDLVDFGTYRTAVSAGCENEEMTFVFNIDQTSLSSRMQYSNDFQYVFQSKARTFQDVTFKVTIGPEAERTRIRRINIAVGTPRVDYDLDVGEDNKIKSLKIDGEDVLPLLHPSWIAISSGTIFPEIAIVGPDLDVSGRVVRPRKRNVDADFVNALKKILKPHVPKKTSDEMLSSLIARVAAAGPTDREGMLDAAKDAGRRNWTKLFEDIVGPDKRGLYSDVSKLISVAALPDLISEIENQLRAILATTLYIGPARARSERYYRYQDLSVSEIDPDGKNFPMFLNSLSPYQISKLSEWIENLFGYGIKIRQESGHISINLTARGMESNIVDTGYGVSQILPVLGQIWWARSRLNQRIARPNISLLAIEQPELHLHPAHQALLADAFVGEVGLTPESGPTAPRIHFLVETHSETLVNRLGELVSLGRLNPADVQLVLFEPKDEQGNITGVRTSSFGASGQLIDWPYGFFQPA